MRRSVAVALVWVTLAQSLVVPSRRRRRRHGVVLVRGGATEELLDSTRKERSQILDGGTSAPSLHDQLVDMVDRVVRLAKRIYNRILYGPPAEEEEVTKEPPKKTRRRPTTVTTAASRKAARIKRELDEFRTSPPEGCKLTIGKSLNVWIITLTGAPNTIFAGEKFKLRVQFPPDYPASPPSVYFLAPTPRHPHVYTNGDICLSLLGEGWSPNLTVPKLALSILSMLSSAKHKGVPQDNSAHCHNPPGKKQEGWMYHDDSA